MYNAAMKVHEFWPASVANFVLLNSKCDRPRVLIVGFGAEKVAAEMEHRCSSADAFEQTPKLSDLRERFDIVIVLASKNMDSRGLAESVANSGEVILIGAPHPAGVIRESEFRRTYWHADRYLVLPSADFPLHYVPDSVTCISAFCDVEHRYNWIRKLHYIAAWKWGIGAARSEHAVAFILTRSHA
jgi:hypothetical protein